jgi:hypothetical protein
VTCRGPRGSPAPLLHRGLLFLFGSSVTSDVVGWSRPGGRDRRARGVGDRLRRRDRRLTCTPHRRPAKLDREPGGAGCQRPDGMSLSGNFLTLKVDRRDAEVRVPELALDDDQRHALAGHLDGVGMPQLVRRKPPPHTGLARHVPQVGARRRRRPSPSTGGPLTTQNGGPTGSPTRTLSHRASCCQAQSSMPDLAAAAALSAADLAAIRAARPGQLR